jgi:fatty acid-binding protein DegV
MQYMLGFVEKQVKPGVPLHGWLAYTRIAGAAQALEKELRARFNWSDIRLFELGPVFGAHMGPGFLGLGFYSDADCQLEGIKCSGSV